MTFYDHNFFELFLFDALFKKFFYWIYTKKRIFEFSLVSVYIEDRPLVFWDFMSYLIHNLWEYGILLVFGILSTLLTIGVITHSFLVLMITFL